MGSEQEQEQRVKDSELRNACINQELKIKDLMKQVSGSTDYISILKYKIEQQSEEIARQRAVIEKLNLCADIDDMLYNDTASKLGGY